MIRAVLFDLDGVLVDADEWHFEALNLALADHDLPTISWQEHLTIYKGIPTSRKLAIYKERHGVETPKTIPYQKQFWTGHFIEAKCKPDPVKVDMIRRLSERYEIGVCSNAIRQTVDTMLDRSGLEVDFSLSNEDVERHKPEPDIYLKAFEELGFRPDECVIVEDSDAGKTAARASGAHVCEVNGPDEVNYYRVLATIRQAEAVNVVIPAAGQGKRFAEAGFLYPKPLIDVYGKPMLQRVLANLSSFGSPIVIAQQAHMDLYGMKDLFPGVTFVPISTQTDGAARTVLHARHLIDNDNELVLANSDQLLEDFDASSFLARMRRLGADGGIVTFEADDPKWSYARCDGDRVVEVAEKRVISDRATVGVYWFRRGRDFVHYAQQMIDKNVRTNGEFYVCPVFNELIADGLSVFQHDGSMVGLGTPEDLGRALVR